MSAARNTIFALVQLCVLSACATSPMGDRPSPRLMEADADRLIIVTLRNDTTVVAPRAGSTPRTYGSRSQYAAAPATQRQARAVAANYKLKEISAWPIGLLGVHCLLYELPASADRAVILERLRRDPRIESAQPLNSFHTLTGESSPAYRTLQHNFTAMNVSGAHRLSRGEGVRVAVIDTALDRDHPNLRERVAHYRDFVDPPGRSPAAERHGTAVAGIIAANGDGPGIVGIAPAAHLYALRACWSDSSDSAEALCNTLTLAKALVAAIDARVDIVNLSLGGPADPLLTRLVRAGMARGLVFVGAIPPSPARNAFPTAISGVIGVDVLGRARNVDTALFAPGEEILILTPRGSYDFLSGSSLSAASISGGAALLLALDKRLSAAEIRALLAASGRHSPTAGVNLCLALVQLVADASCD